MLGCSTALFGGRYAKLNPKMLALYFKASVEAYFFTESEGLKIQSSVVTNIGTETTFDTFNELFRTLRRELQIVVTRKPPNLNDENTQVAEQ